MADISLIPKKINIELLRATAQDLTLEVIDKDCETLIETPRDLTGAIPTLDVYNLAGGLVFTLTGTVSGIDNNVITFSFTEGNLNIYPSIFPFRMLLDGKLLQIGNLDLTENASYRISYPT